MGQSRPPAPPGRGHEVRFPGGTGYEPTLRRGLKQVKAAHGWSAGQIGT
ncbi:hypothetical protein ACFYXC_19930 [Streptomyces sp. NPDC002701]